MKTTEIKKENLINLYNEEGKKHGLWEQYFDNGQLSSRANYVNGERHGVYESYFDNDQLFLRANYVNGKLHGIYELYHLNGKLHSIREYNMDEYVLTNNISLPEGQKEIIKKALKMYQQTIESMNLGEDHPLHHDAFDTKALIGMMNYPVSITISDKDKDSFCHNHGVDFPMFI